MFDRPHCSVLAKVRCKQKLPWQRSRRSSLVCHSVLCQKCRALKGGGTVTQWSDIVTKIGMTVVYKCTAKKARNKGFKWFSATDDSVMMPDEKDKWTLCSTKPLCTHNFTHLHLHYSSSRSQGIGKGKGWKGLRKTDWRKKENTWEMSQAEKSTQHIEEAESYEVMGWTGCSLGNFFILLQDLFWGIIMKKRGMKKSYRPLHKSRPAACVVSLNCAL